jgi:B-block binding subunit of TFIIIC
MSVILLIRSKGVTQRDLCDQLGKKGNNFHYVVRSLETQRLIMRQSTLVREKKQGESVDYSGEPTSVVSTKSLYLPRYGMKLNLNSQQRIEILKPNWNGEEGDYGNEEVSIQDPRPAMKAICDKLEEVKGKVNVFIVVCHHCNYHHYLLNSGANIVILSEEGWEVMSLTFLLLNVHLYSYWDLRMKFSGIFFLSVANFLSNRYMLCQI